jgi:hypothetical protein
MLDEDYYGRGVCKWEFTGAGAMLKATGAEEETRFLTFADAEPLIEGKTHTLFYPDLVYPRTDRVPNFPASGESDRSGYAVDLRDNLFTISLSASEVAP